MSDESGYNGWENFPTWAVKLWLDNDQGSYNYWREQARGYVAQPSGLATPESNVHDLAAQLKDEHEYSTEVAIARAWIGASSVYSDLLSYALGQVNWHEIAQSLISEVIEEDEYEAQS
jgi:hypothetical protein